MKQYQEYLEHILLNGEKREDRTGTGTIATFGYQMRFDLRKGFPLLTTKKMPLRIIFEELKWFLNGDTNVVSLLDKNVHIWDADAYRWYKKHNPDSPLTFEEYIEALEEGALHLAFGELGPIYGKQWRSWGTLDGDTIDQITRVIESLKNDPYSRRHLVSAWNVADLDKMALPPCHVMFQFWVSNNGELSCQLYQRSADSFLGVPFNIASYSLLIHMIASVTGLQVGEFIHTIGDAHIYLDHLEQVKEIIRREPRELPTLEVKRKDSIFDIEWEDIILTNYNPHPPIKAEISVGNK